MLAGADGGFGDGGGGGGGGIEEKDRSESVMSASKFSVSRMSTMVPEGNVNCIECETVAADLWCEKCEVKLFLCFCLEY